jgi:hypothetical protein
MGVSYIINGVGSEVPNVPSEIKEAVEIPVEDFVADNAAEELTREELKAKFSSVVTPLRRSWQS